VLTGVAALIAVSVLALALAGPARRIRICRRSYPPGALAESSWGDFSRAVLARPSVLLQWLRIPVLAGLAIGLITITRQRVRRKCRSDVEGDDREHLGVVVEATPIAIIVLDDRGHIALANEHAQLMFGYSADELRDRDVALLVPSGFAPNTSRFAASIRARPRAGR